MGASQRIATKVGIPHATYERTKKIIAKGSDQEKNELRKGAVVVRKIYSQVSREDKKIDLINKARQSVMVGNRVTISPTTPIRKDDTIPHPVLYNKDFREIIHLEIPSDSVDLIFTDPHYNADALPI